MVEPMIVTHDLTKIYRDLIAVDHLNLTVNEGEIFGFLGPNGAGKTTTILMLTGLSVPNQGTATVGGYDIVNESKKVRKIAGQLPELAGYYEDLTAKQNLDYIGRLNDLSRSEREERIAELLEDVGLTKWKDMKVEKFSRGMKQRLGIAQALMKRPKLVFFDEPTIGLDPAGTKDIHDMFLKLNQEQGLTIVMSSHLLHDIEQTCSKVGIINRGKMTVIDTIVNLKEVVGSADRSIEFKLSETTPELVRELEHLNGVSSVTQKNGRLYVHAEEDSDMEVSKTIVKHGAVILLMRPREYTLEEVIMKYYKEEA